MRPGLLLAVSVLLVVGGTVVWHRSHSGAETSRTAHRSQGANAPPVPRAGARAASARQAPAPIYFQDKCEELGIDFISFSGTTPERAFPTANGTGVGMLDYDQDGTLDLYFANGCCLETPGESPPNALFRSSTGQRFHEVTPLTGAGITGFTQGVAVGDHDNDGFPDLYLVRYGPDMLLANNGDGTFTDCTETTGLDDSRWGTSAAFLDYDEDGSLDLYVANYGKWDMTWHETHVCGVSARNQRLYCSPTQLAPEIHGLFRSSGDGSFRDVAPELGIDRPDGRGQGVVACDVNNDGHIDLYVANDICPNFLFINRGGGRFEDCTLISCAAYNAEGKPEAGMGVDACDTNGDGLPELFVTNFYLEHNTLYQNLSDYLFQDVSNAMGVAAASIFSVGWGTALEDLDGDGWVDIFVTNGHVDDNIKQAYDRDESYAQLPLLFRNRGLGVFEHLKDDTGAYFRERHVGRGAAFGDIDNDGDIDIVVSHKDARPALLSNESGKHNQQANAWTQFQLVGTRSNRDAVGTRVELDAGGQRISRQIRGGKSYLSAHDLRLTIGVGNASRADRVSIHWPSGSITQLEALDINRSYTIREPRDAPRM